MSEAKAVFTIHSCLGEGGYGEVYLATQNTGGGIRRDVAIKVLREMYEDGSDAVKRLRDEGQALALLAHPAILSVHEFVKIDGRLALVMEYIEGADVSWFCDPERLLPERVQIEILREVAEALAHAQSAPNPLTGRPLGLIHRDIKPANVRISVDGKAKLLDFGVARSQEMDRRAKTQVGEVLLTPGFGSPEALGFGVSGPSVDVFALGVSLFEMHTGMSFYGTPDLAFQVALALDSQDFAAHLDKQLARIRNPDIYELCGNMLQFAHEQRSTAAEIADQADAIWRKMNGTTLHQFARTVQFPDLSFDTAPLCRKLIDRDGRIIGEVAQARTAAVAAPPPPPVASSVSPADARVAGPPPASSAPARAPVAPRPPQPPASRGSMKLVIAVAAVAVLCGLTMFGLGLLLVGIACVL